MFKPCLLRYPSDSLDDALHFKSISQALASYEKASMELLHYGQKLEATIHIWNKGIVYEYPNYILSVTRNGNIKKEKA